MKSFTQFLQEAKIVVKDGNVIVSVTKKQKDEVHAQFDAVGEEGSIGKLEGNKLVMTPQQAKKMAERMLDDYHPDWGLESLSKAMTKSMYKLGQEIAKHGR